MNYQVVRDRIPFEVKNDSILDITTNDVTASTHGFHKYPAKFIPLIPRWALNKYALPDSSQIILDPFCGSGTTLLESSLNGNISFGIDIDPLSVLISKVKTTPIDIPLLKEISKWLLLSIGQEHTATFSPVCNTLDHWFTPDAINKLSKIRYLIDSITGLFGDHKETKDIYDLLIICFSSIIRRVSNADNESQKTYVSHTKIKHPEEVNSLFKIQLEHYITRITDYSCNQHIKTPIILNNSSTSSISDLIDGAKIDLAITSPPYIKAIDYIYNQMVELFWIGDLFQMQTQERQNKKKPLYIGNKQIPIIEYKNYSPFINTLGINELDCRLQEIYTTDQKNGHKHSYITFKYFSEMETHFSEMYKCLKTRSHYVMVVGNSEVSNVNIDTAVFLSEIAGRNGFNLTNKWGYKIKSRYMRFDRKGRGGYIDVDWVMDFEKNT